MAKMTKLVQGQVRLPAEQPAAQSRRSALLSALFLLVASMGLSLSDVAKSDSVQSDANAQHKARTYDKNFEKMKDNGYISGQMKPGSTGPTVPPKPTTGSRKK